MSPRDLFPLGGGVARGKPPAPHRGWEGGRRCGAPSPTQPTPSLVGFIFLADKDGEGWWWWWGLENSERRGTKRKKAPFQRGLKMEITLRRRGRGLGAFKASPLPWEAGGELPAPCPWGTGGGRAGQEVPHPGPSSGALGGLQGLWVGGRGGARSCTASVPVATATCLCRSIACTGMRCAVGEGAGGHTGDGEPGDASPRPPVTPAEALHRARVSFCHLGRMPSPAAQIEDRGALGCQESPAGGHQGVLVAAAGRGHCQTSWTTPRASTALGSGARP